GRVLVFSRTRNNKKYIRKNKGRSGLGRGPRRCCRLFTAVLNAKKGLGLYVHLFRWLRARARSEGLLSVGSGRQEVNIVLDWFAAVKASICFMFCNYLCLIKRGTCFFETWGREAACAIRLPRVVDAKQMSER
ncbi:unnamed protein product, partial [Pylaiella littoralis]